MYESMNQTKLITKTQLQTSWLTANKQVQIWVSLISVYSLQLSIPRLPIDFTQSIDSSFFCGLIIDSSKPVEALDRFYIRGLIGAGAPA